MAEKTTIARPYAKAVFALAEAEGKLGEWSEMLQLLASIASDADIKALVGNPSVKQDDLISLFTDVAGDKLNEQGKNLVSVLLESKRVDVLPEITAMFDYLRAEAEKTVDAEVISAFEVSTAQQDKIKAALKNRLGREVTLTCKIDESLIGGAIVQADNLVIDGSVAGQLTRLASAMS